MLSPTSFIVTPLNDERYSSTSNSGLVLSVSQEDHTTTNRMAKIVALPLNYNGGAVVGDILLVHHNTFRKYYAMNGKEKSGPSYFKDNLYFIFYDQYFMYQHDGKWYAPSPFVFVKPTDTPLVGIIKYTNNDSGVAVGDRVAFEPESEYEFNIDGEKLYRMFNRNLTLNLKNTI